MPNRLLIVSRTWRALLGRLNLGGMAAQFADTGTQSRQRRTVARSLSLRAGAARGGAATRAPHRTLAAAVRLTC